MLHEVARNGNLTQDPLICRRLQDAYEILVPRLAAPDKDATEDDVEGQFPLRRARLEIQELLTAVPVGRIGMWPIVARAVPLLAANLNDISNNEVSIGAAYALFHFLRYDDPAMGLEFASAIASAIPQTIISFTEGRAGSADFSDGIPPRDALNLRVLQKIVEHSIVGANQDIKRAVAAVRPRLEARLQMEEAPSESARGTAEAILRITAGIDARAQVPDTEAASSGAGAADFSGMDINGLIREIDRLDKEERFAGTDTSKEKLMVKVNAANKLLEDKISKEVDGALGASELGDLKERLNETFTKNTSRPENEGLAVIVSDELVFYAAEQGEAGLAAIAGNIIDNLPFAGQSPSAVAFIRPNQEGETPQEAQKARTALAIALRELIFEAKVFVYATPQDAAADLTAELKDTGIALKFRYLAGPDEVVEEMTDVEVVHISREVLDALAGIEQLWQATKDFKGAIDMLAEVLKDV